ncbi:glycosyltransferase family 2 protein [Candidatus Contendibacter odensensis]|uniref:Glycosyl transferase, group 2 family n=1 Tax=Candidatus Contendobacter odensis Run_B_J11 TaxID=1400861 RepID=A0A7U7J1F8_9GAMM|nr:glycosyltransferase family 2 protein [Candidatus Contendobacter odensis]CDH43087.1 Glycosyl transferase, group 2 family [Candidatus Contendobacter odensis Run_B_J11]
MIVLAIVVPCYNEEAVLPEMTKRLFSFLDDLAHRQLISEASRVYLVDDGSQDRTWSLIAQQVAIDSRVHGIKLSRNRGHQNALLAGLLHAEGDAVISIDADLQDDLNAIEQMVEEFNVGKDIVYGVRKQRDRDTRFKRMTAEGYYRLLVMMGVEVVFNHADYRLLSRRAIEALRQFREVNLFLRAVIPLLGFSSSIVYYQRKERFAGESKYPLRKMLSLAWQGITSFSAVPLRMITVAGFMIFLGSLSITVWAIGIRLFSDQAVPGWASTVVPIYLMGGIQLLGIGVIGEYLAKTYMETKARPLFIIEQQIPDKNNEPMKDAHPPHS